MAPVNNFNCLRCLLVILALSPTVCFAQPADEHVEETSQATTEVKEQEKKRPRLKYKKGPVCMCNEGMSEADIQEAMKKRQAE